MSELEMPPLTPGSKSGLPLLACLTVCYLVSFASIEWALRGLSDWYPVAVRPPWAPPIWMFAPMWTVLYGLLGVSLWQVWTERREGSAKGIWYFGAQLVLSGGWSWIFFVCHRPLVAFFEAMVLWVFVGLAILAFARVKASAAWLLAPQWVWCAFAAALSFAIYRLNK